MRMNVWTAWEVGMRTKTNGDGSPRAVLVQLARNVARPRRFAWTLSPMDFLRYREFDFALRAVSDLASARPRPSLRRALDIGSPKLLPLTLASCLPRCRITSIDILPREVEWVSNKARLLRIENLDGRIDDARNLGHPSDHFDLVTSISVFEHIAPEIDGDVPAIREMARVLAPGGVAVVTVPFSRSYFADYQAADVYERASHGEPIFFQRFYTEQMLWRNFVEIPGLEMTRLSFVEERYWSQDPRRRIAHWINCSPTQNMIFGPLFPLLSHVFLSPPRPLHKCRKPYIACMLLRKPTATVRLAA
jgi:SAM-dependent methyltransferase